MNTEFVPVKQAAKLAGVSKGAVAGMIASGLIEGRRIPSPARNHPTVTGVRVNDVLFAEANERALAKLREHEAAMREEIAARSRAARLEIAHLLQQRFQPGQGTAGRSPALNRRRVGARGLLPAGKERA